MATKRLRMRQIREILRLKHDQQLSHRAIASACRVGLGTVADYLGRAKQAGLEWPLPEDLDEAALEARLFPRAGPGSRERVAPDVERIHQEVEACWSHPAPAVGRVPRSESKGICLQPVL